MDGIENQTGKETFISRGIASNRFFLNGKKIATKTGSTESGFFTSEGNVLRAFDPDWQKFVNWYDAE